MGQRQTVQTQRVDRDRKYRHRGWTETESIDTQGGTETESIDTEGGTETESIDTEGG